MTHDAPVTWMPIETAPKDGTFILLHEVLAQPPVSVGCYDHECGWLIAEADFMPSKCSPRHWMPLPAAPVADSEDWRKAWRNVALLSSEHEDVRLNEAVAELHSVFEAYAHPPVADRVSTSSPVADRETGNTSDKDLIADAISDSLGPDWTTFDAAHHVMQRLTDEGLCITQAPARGTDCPASHDGFHHVDTSMESGPNNCFHCERPI